MGIQTRFGPCLWQVLLKTGKSRGIPRHVALPWQLPTAQVRRRRGRWLRQICTMAVHQGTLVLVHLHQWL